MHPLLENLHIIKSRLLQLEEGGVCLDVFTLPNDMQIYSSSSFARVLCVATTEHERRLITESAPTRPPSRAVTCNVRSKCGQVYLESLVVFSSAEEAVSCVWIHLHRCAMNDVQFEGLVRRIYNRCAEDATLYVFCVDGELARQYAMAHAVYIDRENNMQMQYHKQPIDTLSAASVLSICERNGFAVKNSIGGDEILRLSNVNCLPYDLWTSQTFSLFQFKSKLHLQRYAR